MDSIKNSNGVNWSDGVNCSDGVNWSFGVNGSHGVNGSYGVNGSHGVNGSYGILNCHGVDNSFFKADKKRTHEVFGKEVSEERFNDVWSSWFEKLNGWYPKFNNAFELYLKAGKEWKKVKASEITNKCEKRYEPYEAWKDMPEEALTWIQELPEFDADIFKRVTGIDVKQEKTVEIVCEGKTVKISRESAKALNLI